MYFPVIDMSKNKKILIAALSILLVFLFSGGCVPRGSVITSLPQGINLTPQFIWRGNYERTGYFDVLPLKKKPELAWQYWHTEEIPMVRFVDSPPVYHKGNVYFCDTCGFLYSLNAGTGKENWKKQIDGVAHKISFIADGVLFFGSGNHIFGIEADTGEISYNFIFDRGIIGKRSGELVLKDDILYFAAERWKKSFIGSPQLAGMYLYALNIKTGKYRWSKYINDALSLDLSFYNDILLATTQNSVLSVDIESGNILWKVPHANNQMFVTPISNGYFYTSDGHSFSAYSAGNGKEVWSINIIPKGSMGEFSNPCINNGTVYFVAGIYDKPHFFYAINAETGKLIWKKDLGEISLYPPTGSYSTTDNMALSRDVAYLSIYNKGAKLVALDITNKKILWEYPTSEEFLRYPPTFANESIYVQDGFYVGKLK
jgi:outer membrane protein assembly factor BamB